MCQTVRGALESGELDVTVHRQTEHCRELAVEVVLGERGDPAQHLKVETVVEVPINVIEHAHHTGTVTVWRFDWRVLHECYVARLWQRSLDQSCYSA